MLKSIRHSQNKIFLSLLFSLLVSLLTTHTQAKTPAPAFELKDIDGNTISLPRKTDGVDIYFFWASWCPYCKALMPHLQSMKIEYGNALTIYALNIRDDQDPAKFIHDKGYDFTVLPKADLLMKPYRLIGVPGLFVVDGDGNVAFNLYQLKSKDSAAFNAKNNKEKAGLRAPWWAAAIRMQIDQVLIRQRAQNAPEKT